MISNCVINLSTDKPAVFAEIARVLKPGGRIGISDVVAEDRLDRAERAERGSYVGCIAGALSKAEYEAGLEAAGLRARSGRVHARRRRRHARRDRQGRQVALNVLFVCVGNQGRSVMAERLFRQAVGERHSARSAGSAPGSATHPQVLEALEELGLDASWTTCPRSSTTNASAGRT